ncbi:GIY-YIG nuclease family protein [Parageobacillus thermoglucosidasius]|uniref:GIY-YIG nuclease family protein n=1 Tax=Parageobacillus thermoglucosidasius TaxID=1426 RepID=UPI0015EF4C93|nr:GIY-YIG nuclease family protein [Parageobacillus thermoglucosidasius]MED4903974.1 GIY-YIG nuclease family protein [Parageobacillus thermoglucosidasius]MED4915702.1 GIY-YIG nuclease family protein [Parageobacillus thermoglucosidasius]MED4945535.1 GIY-YIG nuclease family protein [Parageobacillus thermoglucosidasius]MED4984102.1 GIY-YIG nuclease family protein [Parageobacillus thermoglucosidasius]
MTVTSDEVSKIPRRKGVYVLFDEEKQPLYVGIAKDLRDRLYSHFKGYTHISAYAHHFKSCSVIFEDDLLNRQIYELYLINTLKTPLNFLNNGWKRLKLGVPYPPDQAKKHLCKFVKKDGTPCKNYAHSNGFCHVHGGNGISRAALMRQAKESFRINHS